jgi:hypothetical protein
MYSYRYVYVFLLRSMLCSVCSLPSVLPWLRVFCAFSSVVRQMPGQTSQRGGTVPTLPNYWTVLFYVSFVSIVLFYVLFVSIVLFYVLFVCKCVLYYCHRVATQLQLNISSYHTSYHTISYHISYHTISYISYHINIISYIISYYIISYIISH